MNQLTRSLRRDRLHQRGAVSLLVSLILLFGMTLIAFYANRAFIFEQRTSANQYRSTKAFEMADAGVEWALGQINAGLPVDSACVVTTPALGTSFRQRYVTPTAADATHATGWLSVNANAYPGCRFAANGAATCSCPANGQTSLGSAEQPRFGVAFRSVAGDLTAVELISRGCTNGTSCDPTAADVATSDATAIVRVLVKVVPAIPAGPAAALTTGTATVTGGNLNVTNTHAPSNGITIHAGTSVDMGTGTTVVSMPGTPPRSSVLDNDPTLANLTAASEDAFFSAFFGETLTYYREQNPDVIRIDCTAISAGACGALVVAHINTGRERPRFFITGDVSFSNGTTGLGASLGTQDNPITIVTSGNLEFKSNLTAYGLVYAATATATENWDYDGSGSGTIFGAFISRGAFDKGSGTLNLVYDPSLWGNTGAPNGRLVKVPGSWRDRATDF
jgi:Tfp pilus assembly protein PilX